MKKTIYSLILFIFFSQMSVHAQAPAQATDVMLQAFYWDSYSQSRWTVLQSQASELSASFDMLWLPPSGDANSPYSSTMGYTDVYWFRQNSSFGSETELKNLITTLKNSGTRCIADIVINHRNGVTNWTDFPVETYNGITYTPNLYWICSNDEVAGQAGQAKPLGGTDEGDNFGGARDLDHRNVDLQNTIKAYLQFMKNDMGYDGWRYDMTKGYPGSYNDMYNKSAGAYYSVGEYWDGSYDALYAWLQKANFNSTTFDFSFKYALNNWASTGDLTKLVWTYNSANQPAGLIHNPLVRRYATTFIDNHDTFRDSNKFTGDVLMANAFMLCSPGIPCVALPHWIQYKAQIQAMIAARHAVQLHSESAVVVNQSGSNIYVATVTGKNGSLIVKLGSASYSAPSDYKLVTSGNNYAIWIKGGSLVPVLTITPNSGTYSYGQTLTMSATGSANIYYTTDGSTPTASSSKYTVPITLPLGSTNLKAIAIGASASSNVASYTYNIIEKASAILVRFKAPETWTSGSVYVWEMVNGSAVQLAGAWPGKAITKDTQGYYSYSITNFTQPVVNVIFNDGKSSGAEQTVDLSTTANICWKYGSVATTSPVKKYNADLDPSCTTAVEQIQENVWSVYPNPTTGRINIQTDRKLEKLVVYSVTGKILETIKGGLKEIDLTAYANGIYFISASDEDGRVATKQIIKQ